MSDFFLADDLSGALDAAAAFHHVGRRVRVVLSTEAWTCEAADDVVGVTTETRNSRPEEAARAVARAIDRGRAAGGKLLFKKIDSTLRGPVAAELAALAAAMPGTRILFTPANPRVGRTVAVGVLYVNGVPVAETDFARDPLCPVQESSIARLLGPALAGRVLIAEAETTDDLATAVKAAGAAGGPWVAVGSGALAVAVAQARHGADRPPASGRVGNFESGGVDRVMVRPGESGTATARAEVSDSPVLMIGGSAHAANRAQAESLWREHGVPAHEIEVTDAGEAMRAAGASLQATGSAALTLPARRMESATALRAITTAAANAIGASGVRRIFVTGGETAFALCGLLGISSLAYLTEIEPGLSLSHGLGRNGAMLLAVKPGGFGDARTWIRAWTELRGAR